MREINPEDYLYLIDMVLQKSHYRSVLRAFCIEYEDAYQIGAVGLIRSAKAYRPEICTFPAFAVMRIKRELNHYFRHINRPLRRGRPLSLDVPLQSSKSFSLMDVIADTRSFSEFDKSLIEVMLDKLPEPERQLVYLLLQFDGVPGGKRHSHECLKISRNKFDNLVKSLKNQVIEIFDYAPERRTANV